MTMTDTLTVEFDDELHVLVKELDGSKRINNNVQRAEEVERIKIRVLIDIAASLRIMSGGLPEFESVPGYVDPPAEPEERESDDDAPLDVGDWVVGKLLPDELEPTPNEVVAVGESEGQAWVVLDVDGVASPRFWAAAYRRVEAPNDEPDDREQRVADIAAITDELDGDFDGDNHAAAERARKALAKAERKAAKGKSGKLPADVVDPGPEAD